MSSKHPIKNIPCNQNIITIKASKPAFNKHCLICHWKADPPLLMRQTGARGLSPTYASVLTGVLCHKGKSVFGLRDGSVGDTLAILARRPESGLWEPKEKARQAWNLWVILTPWSRTQGNTAASWLARTSQLRHEHTYTQHAHTDAKGGFICNRRRK